jgi:hypothetical protein
MSVWLETYIYLFMFSSMRVHTLIYSRTIPWYFLHVKKLLLLVNLDVCVYQLVVANLDVCVFRIHLVMYVLSNNDHHVLVDNSVIIWHRLLFSRIQLIIIHNGHLEQSNSCFGGLFWFKACIFITRFEWNRWNIQILPQLKSSPDFKQPQLNETCGVRLGKSCDDYSGLAL